MYDPAKTQNPDVLDAKSIDLVGGYRLLLPEKAGPFYLDGKPINFGHVRNPTETYNPTVKNVDTGVYGPLQTVLEVTTKVEETGAFETASVKDVRLRSLWAGSPAFGGEGASTAEPWAASTTYALGDLVVPTTDNGHYYEVTTAGQTSTTEPTSWKTDGGTNTSGTVTFTDRGLISTSGTNLIVIPRNHQNFTGMLIDVTTSAITGRNSEIYIAPNISLRGDGYGGGRNSTDETTIKFAYRVLGAQGYKLPATVGDFSTVQTNGGLDILNVPPEEVNAVIDKIAVGYYA
ncbi:hypothetical protein [Deinococcus hohokamensis]|uniref:Uncharacterized protein n=1 Tax=Deinococcus hohokamensis TaxID=309883 RepID=A0ABV9I5B1_9DEIO